jgi:hypothetical protein
MISEVVTARSAMATGKHKKSRKKRNSKAPLTLGANGMPVQHKAPNALLVGGRARLPKPRQWNRAGNVEVSYLPPDELARRRADAGLPPIRPGTPPTDSLR